MTDYILLKCFKQKTAELYVGKGLFIEFIVYFACNSKFITEAFFPIDILYVHKQEPSNCSRNELVMRIINPVIGHAGVVECGKESKT